MVGLEDSFHCESSPSVLLEIGCLVHCCVCLASRTMSFWVFSVSFSYFDGGSLGLQTHYWARPCVASGDLNSVLTSAWKALCLLSSRHAIPHPSQSEEAEPSSKCQDIKPSKTQTKRTRLSSLVTFGWHGTSSLCEDENQPIRKWGKLELAGRLWGVGVSEWLAEGVINADSSMNSDCCNAQCVLKPVT